jgi:hypothetical protein
MFALLGVLIALLAIEEDEDERLRIVLGILAMFIHIQQYNMLRNHSNRLCALISASVFLLRDDPSGAYSWQGSTICRTIYKEANRSEFKRMFRMKAKAAQMYTYT